MPPHVAAMVEEPRPGVRTVPEAAELEPGLERRLPDGVLRVGSVQEHPAGQAAAGLDQRSDQVLEDSTVTGQRPLDQLSRA